MQISWLNRFQYTTESYVELPGFSLGQLDSGTGTIVAARPTGVRRALDLMGTLHSKTVWLTVAFRTGQHHRRTCRHISHRVDSGRTSERRMVDYARGKLLFFRYKEAMSWTMMFKESTDTFIYHAYPQGASHIIVVGRQRGIIDVKRRLAVAAEAC